MFKHLLLPADGSDNAQRAIEKALGLAQAFQSRVTAIYVIDPYAFSGVGADFAYGQAEYLSAAALRPPWVGSERCGIAQAQGLAGDRMRQFQLPCMQQQPGGGGTAVRRIQGIAHDGVAQGLQVHAQLVRAARQRLQ